MNIDKDNEEQEEETKCKQKNRGKKRKRVSSESSSDEEDVLPENTLEMEKNLHASAIKNNLDDISVKKILKKVVTNDHVLALVKLREEEEDSGTEENLRPKITRAKAKELMKVSPKSAPWNLELTPIKHIPVKTRPEVKALIAQELPDDEDDEEYEPTHEDVPSDDDHVLESSSDVDSLPRTPATPRGQRKTSPKVVNDGPFKVPQQDLTASVRKKLVLEEEATIALRTRSKLSLSATSIEHIESSFVPPDDLPMPDVDSLWNDFLEDCLNPASNARHEDDDEADPEYNVAADPDANEEDEESLENSIIKISKKELNDLVTELFSIMPDSTADQITDNIVQDVLIEHTTLQTSVTTHREGKQEPDTEAESTAATQPAAVGGERASIGKCLPEDENSKWHNSEENVTDNCQSDVVEKEPETSAPPPAVPVAPEPLKQKSAPKQPPGLLRGMFSKPNRIRVEIPKNECSMLPEQLALLQQQLRQHIQVATSSYLQLFVHPTHWARAPVYKEYLVSFEKMLEKKPTSVVNVCNLKPALELMASWETAVSDNTKENREMVKFIQKEEERCRRRAAQNSYQVGDFPDTFLKVVANSPVFLYPQLLPGMPFRPDIAHRRNTYLRAEDELIALGLDQFWEYVYANPEIYKKPAYVHPRHRWGYAATVELVCKHMLPWLQPKTLMGHLRHIKKGTDTDNPIHKFFQSRKVEPVKHRLLQFNPQLTLYEQPEHEMPRIWIRYLAKSSSRFKKYLYSRNKQSTVAPNGVDLQVNVQATTKTPLPIDFNKEINCSRLNLLPKKDEVLVNRIDVPINNGAVVQPLVASEIFTVVNTSTGAILVPLLMQTRTVDSNTTPICSALENPLADNEADEVKTAEGISPNISELLIRHTNNSEHCSCCILIRNICRRRKKTITDYYGGTLTSDDSCRCRNRRYPRMTNRLKLLLKNYRTHSKAIFDELQYKLNTLRKENEGGAGTTNDMLISDDDENDLVTATVFQLKLTTVTATVRNNFTKKRIHTLFSKFDAQAGDVLRLVTKLFKICEEELFEFYKEFMGFLTAEQADRVGHFKDYFVQRCMENLIKKIEELVSDKHNQCRMLTFLESNFFTSASLGWSACDLCSALLQRAAATPPLARYVFSLFPHRHAHSETQIKKHEADCVPLTGSVNSAEENETTDIQKSVDYEANDSSSDDEEEHENTDATLSGAKPSVNIHEDTLVKVENEENDIHSVSRAETSDDSTDVSRLVMSDDNTTIKTETPEWKRDEDKVILEVLKQHITPEERKNKTILEVLEETPALALIADGLPQKSVNDVKERILYLLQLLVAGDL